MEEYAGRCKKFFFGRRSFTHLWLGYGPEPCPLVPNSDLGEWNRKKTFWKNADALRPVNGFIDIIDGPQAGNILIDGKVKVFFVPQRKLKAPQDNFYPNKDENIPVHFLLGFTPEGLRAWEVTRGHVENGNRIAHGQRARVNHRNARECVTR